MGPGGPPGPPGFGPGPGPASTSYAVAGCSKTALAGHQAHLHRKWIVGARRAPCLHAPVTYWAV
ncbi:hypothetical protein AKJ16_DCAP15103 [Drosera capensis]